MPATVTVRDESTSGGRLHELTLDLLNERVTVRELIRSRVYQEVQDYNLRRPELYHGLVQPADAERTLSGYRVPGRREIDWKEQFERAVEGFERSQVLILVDDRQAESLDEEIELKPGRSVSFVRLTPLVGG